MNTGALDKFNRGKVEAQEALERIKVQRRKKGSSTNIIKGPVP